MQAPCIFQRILSLLFRWAILLQVPYFSTEKTLPHFRPFPSRPSLCTQLHRHCATTISQLITKPLLPTTMLTTVLRPISRRIPYCAVGRVSCMHGIMQGGRMLQHDLLLYLWLPAAQVGHENILRRHDMPHLQHQALEFFNVFCHRPLLS